jgi:hypothetical protein
MWAKTASHSAFCLRACGDSCDPKEIIRVQQDFFAQLIPPSPFGETAAPLEELLYASRKGKNPSGV